jgi:DNA-binding LytR/AlgR family response regulator
MVIYLINSALAYCKNLFDIYESPQQSSATKFSIRQGGKIYLLKYSDVLYAEASGNHINVYAEGQKFVTRRSIADWLSEANQDYLLRVHRSYVVNIAFIKELVLSSDGLPTICLEGGQSIKIGKQYKAETYKKIGIDD